MENGRPPGLLTRRTVLLASGAGVVVVIAGAELHRTGRLQWASSMPADRMLSAPDTLERMRAGELVLIDIRRPDEWADTGSPESAIRLDMRRSDFTESLRQALATTKDRQVALICAAGVRSARLARKLSNSGFGDVYDVPEGMLGSTAGPGWIARGLPLSKR